MLLKTTQLAPAKITAGVRTRQTQLLPATQGERLARVN